MNWYRKSLAILLFLALSSVSVASRADYLVIAHPSVQEEVISKRKLAQIYALQLKVWPSGQSIKVSTLPANSELHRNFVRNKLKLQPHQLDRLWNRLLFTGVGRPPQIVDDARSMLNSIEMNEGAIGYLADDVNLDLSGVKILQVGP